jgi:hypothetical protein
MEMMGPCDKLNVYIHDKKLEYGFDFFIIATRALVIQARSAAVASL